MQQKNDFFIGKQSLKLLLLQFTKHATHPEKGFYDLVFNSIKILEFGAHLHSGGNDFDHHLFPFLLNQIWETRSVV